MINYDIVFNGPFSNVPLDSSILAPWITGTINDPSPNDIGGHAFFDDTFIVFSGTHVDIDVGVGDDSVYAIGNLTGNVNLGDGNDTLFVHSDVIGDIDAGAGDDSVFINNDGANPLISNWDTGSGVVGDIDLGDGEDTLYVFTNVHGDIYAGDGNDSLHVSRGNIFGDVDLGGGDDTLIVGHTRADDYFDGRIMNGDIDAGSGDDLIKMLRFGTAGDGYTMTLGDGADTLWVGTSLYADGTVYGDDGDDSIYFGAIMSDSGAIFGGEGDDFIRVNFANSGTISGGIGDDTIIVNGGANVVYGNEGNDSIGPDTNYQPNPNYRGDGNDTIFGGDGDDTIKVEISNYSYQPDVVSGGNGRDEITAMIGLNDSGRLIVTDLSTEDTLWIEGATSADVASVTNVDGDVALHLDGGATFTLEGVGDGTIDSLVDLATAGYNIDFT